MKRNYLKPLTIFLGIGMFISGLSISLSSMGSANYSLEETTDCWGYDSDVSDDCPAQTSATVSVSGGGSQTVGLQNGSNGTYTISFDLFGTPTTVTIPRRGGKTVQTFMGTNGNMYTVTINMDHDYKILCIERTSPGGGPCTAYDCKGNMLTTYQCHHPGTGTGTSN